MQPTFLSLTSRKARAEKLACLLLHRYWKCKVLFRRFGDRRSAVVANGRHRSGNVSCQRFFPGGTDAVKDLVNVNGTLFFSAKDATCRVALWKKRWHVERDCSIEVCRYAKHAETITVPFCFVETMEQDSKYGEVMAPKAVLLHLKT